MKLLDFFMICKITPLREPSMRQELRFWQGLLCGLVTGTASDLSKANFVQTQKWKRRRWGKTPRHKKARQESVQHSPSRTREERPTMRWVHTPYFEHTVCISTGEVRKRDAGAGPMGAAYRPHAAEDNCECIAKELAVSLPKALWDFFLSCNLTMQFECERL